ncbi:MAG TPA: SdpI family protein [Bacteroidia bacterium]|nr:SdpI family protein [Bacteroidia bacterium]
MKSKAVLIATLLLINLMPLVYLALIWRSLPEQVPMHYNIHNQVDRMGSRNEQLYLTLFMSAIGFGVALLMLFIHKIDPKKSYSENSNLMRKMAWTVSIFISILSGFIIYQAQTFAKSENFSFSGKTVLVLVSLIFVVLGNFINNVKPNYFVGFRTPWNLENEENWRLTHRLASKLMFFGGIGLILLVLVLPEPYSAYAFTASLIPIVLVPFVYSYLLFKREKQ